MEPDSPNQFDDDQIGKVFGQLEGIITSRKASKSERSYTSKLLAAGVVKIGSKVTEEAGELVEAAINEVDERVISEAADLFYHAMVLLACRDLT
ncbi:MAG: phosphoribosyl-ATP diphosphatase, partial [Planctomycetaceae bacterium]|nr:phosphoribosyl-ATP diphosphatase [Planctomycetaceae bacterium]